MLEGAESFEGWRMRSERPGPPGGEEMNWWWERDKFCLVTPSREFPFMIMSESQRLTLTLRSYPSNCIAHLISPLPQPLHSATSPTTGPSQPAPATIFTHTANNKLTQTLRH